MSILKSEYDKNVFLNYFFKIVGALLSFVAARYILGFLGSSLYGLWITISSIVSWLGNGDLGIGNGLRNALAKAYGENNISEQKALIGSAFNLLTKVSAVLFMSMIVLCEIFIATSILPSECRIPAIITTAFFCVNLVLGITQSIALSYQQSWLSSFSLCFNNLSILSLLFIINLLSFSGNLVLFSIINGISSIIPNLILIIILHKKGVHFFMEKSQRITAKDKKIIVNSGIGFFGLQLCCLVLYSTDSLIIENLFGEKMVTEYSLISKIYDSGTSLFSIALVSFWSAVTYKIAQKDYTWIKDRIKKLLELWAVFSAGVVLVSVILNPIVRLWIGNDAPLYNSNLILLFGAYCCVFAFSSIFTYMINGTGKIKLQLILLVCGAIINIPLSIFLGVYYNMGIFGIKLATLISISFTVIAMPIQAYLIMKKWPDSKAKQIVE